MKKTLGLTLVIFLLVGGWTAANDQKFKGYDPDFRLITPPAGYNERLREARGTSGDYFWKRLQASGKEITYENVKDFLAPLRYVNAPWRYVGVILSPRGSTQKMRVIENGFRIDANLTRATPQDASAWALGDTHLWVMVGAKDEFFGEDEHRQGQPSYENGYLPVFQTEYKADGVTYEQTVFAHPLIARYRSPYIDEPGNAAYIRIRPKDGQGQVALYLEGPEPDYGFPIVKGGVRDNRWTDTHNNVFAWFSGGGSQDEKSGFLRYRLNPGESVYVVFPHQVQLAGTRAVPDQQLFEQAKARLVAGWNRELDRGGAIYVPEKVVMDAYRSLLIGNWQLTIGDELPYGMFSYYEGNGYAETLQYIAPFIEYGYLDDARRFIQPILEYPLSDTGIGLHVCANRLELASYYHALSGDSDFVRRNLPRLIEVADYLLARTEPDTGLVLDGYGFDLADQQVVNLNTNSNGWRAIRNLAGTLAAIGEKDLGSKYLKVADEFGQKVRQAVLDNIDRSVKPPFVPFALGDEKAYGSLVENRSSSYYNIVMPYFFESEIFPPKSEPYTHVLDYMWNRQGVMAGLNRFAQHGNLPLQDGIHPLYTWGRQFAQISRHEVDRVLYTFYCSLAHGYTRGTFLTGENQGTVPSESEWYRGTYMPPEPPANALLLRSLRHMLIHETDEGQDGVYDELRLLSCTPQAWLEEGKRIALDRMPTRFGTVSLDLRSEILTGKLRGEASLEPGGTAGKVRLFVRLPKPYRANKIELENGRSVLPTQVDGDSAFYLPVTEKTLKFTVLVER